VLVDDSASAERAFAHGSEPAESLPDVSVVIPTRNRSAYLSEAVASVQAQTLSAWELIVVDDASDDESAEAAERLTGSDRRMHLIALSEHSERSAARNSGLARASGRYVLFLDDDDRLLPKALERLARVLQNDPSASIAIGARRAFDQRGNARRAPHPRVRVRRKLAPELLLGWLSVWLAVPGQCLLRTDDLRAAGGWNRTLVGPEDQELLLRITQDRPAVLIPQAVLEYRLHDSQWRPPDVAAQEAAFRRDIARQLAAAGRGDTAELLRAGDLLRAADARYDAHSYSQALRLYWAAAKAAPAIPTSPLVAPPYVHLVAKSFAGACAGRHGSRLVRGSRGRVRRLLRRAPLARVTVLEETPFLPGRADGYQAADVQPDDPVQ
jgi:glycosyltransferase involved in cell wall biosynthesis